MNMMPDLKSFEKLLPDQNNFSSDIILWMQNFSSHKYLTKENTIHCKPASNSLWIIIQPFSPKWNWSSLISGSLQLTHCHKDPSPMLGLAFSSLKRLNSLLYFIDLQNKCELRNILIKAKLLRTISDLRNKSSTQENIHAETEST